jgi:hypothetical protein
MANTAAVVLGLILATQVGFGALISRTVTFEDGNILTAAQLNGEFNNVVNGVNSIDNANIATGANIDPAKISAALAGTAIVRSATGVLSVGVDDSTIETNADLIRVKDSGITSAKILNGTIVNADIDTDTIEGTRLNTNVADGTTIELSSDQLQIKNGGVAQAKLATRTVTTNGTDPGAGGVCITASSGNFLRTANSYAQVTNFSCTLTTLGRPVEIRVISDGAPHGTSDVDSGVIRAIQSIPVFKLERGGVPIAYYTAGEGGPASDDRIPSSVLTFTDAAPVAGTYTYILYMRAVPGVANNAYLSFSKMMVYEI